MSAAEAVMLGVLVYVLLCGGHTRHQWWCLFCHMGRLCRTIERRTERRVW